MVHQNAEVYQRRWMVIKRRIEKFLKRKNCIVKIDEKISYIKQMQYKQYRYSKFQFSKF